MLERFLYYRDICVTEMSVLDSCPQLIRKVSYFIIKNSSVVRPSVYQ